jgi:predicted 3-demethylubiquinone-9 3-methyltransferase (glyoxalase superfamily)
MEHASKVRICLWFERGGHEAAQEYVKLVPDSKIDIAALEAAARNEAAHG